MLTNDNVLELFKRQDENLSRIEKRHDESIERLEANLKEFVVGSVSLSHANLIIELTPIKDHLHDLSAKVSIQNGRVSKNEDCLQTVQDQTRFFRWLGRNPVLAAVMLIGLFIGGAWGYHRINVIKTVENTTGVVIEQKDTPQ